MQEWLDNLSKISLFSLILKWVIFICTVNPAQGSESLTLVLDSSLATHWICRSRGIFLQGSKLPDSSQDPLQKSLAPFILASE